MPRHLRKLLTLAIVVLLSGASLCAATERAPDEKELKKAEKVLTKLAQLRATSVDLSGYRAAVRKFYPGLFINVSNLGVGDLKTDLSTAVFLYEKADGLLGEGDATAADCGAEIRDLYRNLCLARSPQTRAQLILLKAQLHTRWAEALIRFYGGGRDALTIAALSEMRQERAIDLTLAERAVTLLKTVDEKVNAYPSLAEFEEHGRVAQVPFDQLSSDFKTVASNARQLLSSLPRSPIYYNLQNALSSYGDGLFFWEKTYRRKAMVVNANNWVEPDAPKARALDAGVVDYTVVCNWRNARKYITKAAIEIERARDQITIGE